MSNQEVSLVISLNDLEATEIYRLAQEHGFHCVDVELSWGGRLQRAHPKLKLDELKDTVVLVELPAQDVEDWLRANGRTVQIIDHHLYIDFQGRRLDRRRPKSSLEQFADLFGIGLNEEQRLIAANDRGFWPAMLDTFEPVSQDATVEEKRQAWQECLVNVHAIRLRDLAFRFGGDETRAGEEVERAIEWLDGAETAGLLRVIGCGRGQASDPEMILLRAPDALRSVMVDAIYIAHYFQPDGGAGGLRRWRNTRDCLPDAPLEILALFETASVSGRASGGGAASAARHITQIEYSGPADRVPLLNELVDELATASRLRLWAGGGNHSCFLGADAGAASRQELAKLGDQLLNAILAGNRPLIRWRSQFMQVLRYDTGSDYAGRRPEIAEETAQYYRDGAVGEPVRNYVLDYVRPYLTPLPQDGGAEPEGEHRMRRVDDAGPLDPWSLTIHSYCWKPDKPLPRLRIAWSDTVADERPLAHLAVHFLFGGLVVLEWAFQDGWPEHDAAFAAAEGRLFDQLLRYPQLERDGRGFTRLRGGNQEPQASAFAPHIEGAYDDRTDYPTLAFQTEHVPGVASVAELLNFNDAARQCYSSFYAPSAQKKISLILSPTGSVQERTPSLRSPLMFGAKTQSSARRPAAWFADLVDLALEPFSLDSKGLLLVLDERARVVTAAACVGSRPSLPAAVDMQEILFARLVTVEPFSPFHFYDRSFSKSEIGRARYDRFRTQDEFPGSSQLYAVTDHSLAFFGHGWFAANVAIKHVACEYHRLYLIGLLYVCVFHGFSHDLAELSRQRLAIDGRRQQLDRDIEGAAARCKPARQLRAEREAQWRELDRLAQRAQRIKTLFTGFANGLWFDDISTQIQGRELFAKIADQLRVDEPYREINDEIERTDALERADAAQRSERRAKELTVLATAVGTLAAIGTVIGPVVGGIGWGIVPALLLALVAPIFVLAMTRSLSWRAAMAEIAGLPLPRWPTGDNRSRSRCRDQKK